MRLALVQAPVFDHRTPSNALALWSAVLQREGVECVLHDANKCVTRGFSELLRADFQDARTFMPVLDRHEEQTRRFLELEADHILASDPDMVGFSVLARTEKYSLELAELIKKKAPQCRIVFGGAQCLRENMAAEFAAHPAVDAVALAEADLSFPNFLKAWGGRAGRLPAVPGILVKDGNQVLDGGDAPVIENLDDLPFMDFSAFHLPDYCGDVLYLNTTRGCVRKCSFCTHILGQKTFRTMSAERTVAEIRHQIERHPERSVVEFTDSLVNGNVRRLANIADLLAQYRIERLVSKIHRGRDFSWLGMAILHPTMTPALLERLRRSGCIQLKYGLESASQKVLNSMQKKFRIEDAQEIIRSTHKAGISVFLFILVGFPTETEADFQETVSFIERNAEFIGTVGVSSCEIQKGSHMDIHPDAYNIKLPLDDRLRWTTNDGANTYEIRQDRLQRMQSLLNRLDLSKYEFPTRLGMTLKSEPEYDFYHLAAGLET